MAGISTVAVGEAECAIATFDLTDTEIIYLDRIDFMGACFTPCQNIAHPALGDFFWDESQHYCSVFMSELLGVRAGE